MKLEWKPSRRSSPHIEETAWLGDVEVGAVQIQASDGGRRLAVWTSYLGPKNEWKSAYSVMQAKAALELHVRDWVKKAAATLQDRNAA